MDPVVNPLWPSSINLSHLIPNCGGVSSNGSKSFSGDQFSSHRSPLVYTSLVVLYAAISGFGCIFNVIIVIVIVFVMPRLLQNVTNIFVLTLAFSDIFMCAFNMPIQVFYEREQLNWNDDLCRILFTSFGLPLYISTFTILLIAIDRYRMILYPLEVKMSRPVAVALVGGTIVISAINAIPVAFYSKLSIPMSNETSLKFQYCIEQWPSHELRLAYSLWTFTVQFFSPLVITAILYFQIYARLRRRMVTKKDDEKKKRTNRILMGIVICFAVCWTPFAIYSLLLEIKGYIKNSVAKTSIGNFGAALEDPLQDQAGIESSSMLLTMAYLECYKTRVAGINIPDKHIKLIDLLLKVFAMASACINPFLYGWLNESIRDSINKALGWGKQGQNLTKTSYALASTRYTPGDNGPNGIRSAPSHMEISARLEVMESNGITKTKEEEEEEAAILAAEDCEDLPTIIVHSPSACPPDQECCDSTDI